MITIKKIEGSEVLDSRGNPTVQVKVTLSNSLSSFATVPSGASTGKREAIELRDGGNRYLGKGVLKACENINSKISNKLVGISPFNQKIVDKIMKDLDGTENYKNLGANSVLGVSIAVARVSALSLNIPLYRYLGGVNAQTIPTPMINIINGGEHANNSVDFQEYMIIPKGFKNFSESLRASVEIYHNLKKIINNLGESTAVGDEGGFAPNLKNNEEPLTLIVEAIKNAGYEAGKNIFLALDVAASEFIQDDDKYFLKSENKILSSDEMIYY